MRSPDEPEMCPFCGNEDIETIERVGSTRRGTHREWFWVSCGECDSDGEVAMN